MKIVVRIAIIVAIVLINSLTSNSNELNQNDTIISVLNVREDLINKAITNEILIFAKFSQGEFKVVSHWDNRRNTMISQRKSILGNHKKFRVYRHGLALGEIAVSKVQLSPFDCEELIVGFSKKNTIKDVSRHESNTSDISSGFNQFGKFEYKNTRFLAINSDSPSIKNQQYSKPLSNTISENTKKIIYDFVSKSLLRKNNQINLSNIQISTFQIYDLNHDNKAEYLIVAKGENDTTKESGVFVINIDGSTVIPLLNEGMNNRPNSWGNGYELLGVLDIDGDTIPELIFETKGYESTGYDIFKLKKNKFIKVFSDVTYGC